MGNYVHIGQLSRPGKGKRENEDTMLAYVPRHPNTIERRGALFAVADGVGGHPGGKVASYLAAQYVWRAYYADNINAPHIALHKATDLANRWLHYWASVRADLREMRTTLTVAVIWDGELIIAHVGDSRAYLVRGGYAWLLTHDHTWVAEAMAQGLLTPQEAARHPWRHVLTRSLQGDNVTVDIARWQYRSGDRLVLCTDGVYDALASQEIAWLARYRPPRAARALVRRAYQRWGQDDASVLVVALKRSMRRNQPVSYNFGRVAAYGM